MKSAIESDNFELFQAMLSVDTFKTEFKAKHGELIGIAISNLNDGEFLSYILDLNL